MTILLLLFIFVLAVFLGFELINKVPSQLHTPLMSGSNAISGITLVGALAATAIEGTFGTILATVAVAFATINVVGGYLVTDRMFGMFRTGGGAGRRGGPAGEAGSGAGSGAGGASGAGARKADRA